MDWKAFDAVLLRSCWDYHLRPAAFARWLDGLEAAEVRLWNPPHIARWNMDKRYLDDLAALGVPVVPSVRLTRGSPPDLAALLERRGWGEAVVKPAVSANAHATWRVRAGGARARQDTLRSMLAAGDVIVQPFVEAVRSRGEWSLMFFQGEFSHAVLKRPAEGEFRVQERVGGRAVLATPEPEVLHAAADVLSRLPHPGLYARVDGVATPQGWMLMELEMLEPSLFFAHHPPAAGRLAGIVRGLVHHGHGRASPELPGHAHAETRGAPAGTARSLPSPRDA